MITRIHHVAIAVRSIETALHFYQTSLGLAVGQRAEVADQGVQAVLLPLEEGEIELLEPTDPTGGVARFLERRGEGPHHLCLETPDVSAAMAQAKAAGLPLIDQTPRPGLAGLIGFLHPKACHGLLVELAQPQGKPDPPESQPGGIQAVGVDPVYLAAKDADAAAASLTRILGASPAPPHDDARLEARHVRLRVGQGRIVVLSPLHPGGPSDLARFLADRGEGLYGVGLRVRDFRGALQHLQDLGTPLEVRGADTPAPLAHLPPGRTHGVNLFLSPLTMAE